MNDDKTSEFPLDATMRDTLPGAWKTPGADQQATLRAYLVVLSGVDAGKRFELDKPSYVFGRGRDADIVISDPKMSRRHGMLTIRPDGIVLEDLRSTNGTYVDGARIERKPLDPKSRIRAGITEMRIDYKNSRETSFEENLFKAATTDALTGVANRVAFINHAEPELAFCRRNDFFLTLVMADVDHFKRTNDTFGHPAGDYVLKELARLLTRQLRREDLLGRYGGEEFMLLLRRSESAVAGACCERIRRAVEMYRFEFAGQAIPTTMSFGVCCRQGEQIPALEDLIRLADEALYQAKGDGRNRIVVV